MVQSGGGHLRFRAIGQRGAEQVSAQSAGQRGIKHSHGAADAADMAHSLLWLLVLIVALGFLSGLRVVPEAQRLVVLRLGRFRCVLQPGLRWILPGIDRTLRVPLSAAVANWQSLSEVELQETLRQLVTTGRLLIPVEPR